MKTIIIVLAALSLSASMAFAQHRDFHRDVVERHFGGVRVVPNVTDPCLTWNGVTWVNTCVSSGPIYRGGVYREGFRRGVGVRHH